MEKSPQKKTDFYETFGTLYGNKTLRDRDVKLSQSVNYNIVSNQDLNHHFYRITAEEADDKGKALFYSIKRYDFKEANYWIDQGADINRSFEVSKNVFQTTTDLIVNMLIDIKTKNGHRGIVYVKVEQVFDRILQVQGINLRCTCSGKFGHHCVLYKAFKKFKIQNEKDIFKRENLLIRKLILNGATIKRDPLKPIFTFNIPWFNVDQIRNYLIGQEELKQITIRQSPQKSTQNVFSPIKTAEFSQQKI